jgi:hypothetical protein
MESQEARREYTRKMLGRDRLLDVRHAICEDLDVAIEARLRRSRFEKSSKEALRSRIARDEPRTAPANNMPIPNRAIKGIKWMIEDLEEAGIPRKHQEYTLEIFAKEAVSPRLDPFKGWQDDRVQGEIANWALSPKILPGPYDFKYQWWHDIFQWLYGKSMLEVREAYNNTFQGPAPQRW